MSFLISFKLQLQTTWCQETSKMNINILNDLIEKKSMIHHMAMTFNFSRTLSIKQWIKFGDAIDCTVQMMNILKGRFKV